MLSVSGGEVAATLRIRAESGTTEGPESPGTDRWSHSRRSGAHQSRVTRRSETHHEHHPDTITDTTTAGRDNRRKRRIVGVAALATAGALVLGLGYAFFSDSVLGQGSATAGTLDLNGSLGVSQNGTTDADGVVPNLNPGDVLAVAGPITNDGSKSAWIRTKVTGKNVDPAIASSLVVYAGQNVPTQAQVLAASDPTTLPGYVGTGAGLATGFTTTPLVIAGTGTNAEATAAENTTATTGAYNANVVVYFAKGATNAAQNKSFGVDVAVQAVQYRNNTNLANVDWTAIETGTIASGTWQ